MDWNGDVHKGFFAERVVKPRNCLPAELHHFSSLSIFKSFVYSTDLSHFVTCEFTFIGISVADSGHLS